MLIHPWVFSREGQVRWGAVGVQVGKRGRVQMQYFVDTQLIWSAIEEHALRGKGTKVFQKHNAHIDGFEPPM